MLARSQCIETQDFVLLLCVTNLGFVGYLHDWVEGTFFSAEIQK